MIRNPKYKLGDMLHFYYTRSTSITIECPLCKGEKQLILQDGRKTPCTYCDNGKKTEPYRAIEFDSLVVDQIFIKIEWDGTYVSYADTGCRKDCYEEEAFLTLKEAKEHASKINQGD